jgi:carbon-monoxide dehydrogenase small subunit
MKISQEFTVSLPLPAVWAFFHDVPKVAACLPGAEYLGPRADGKQTGRVSSRIGPFQTSFEGEADVAYDEEAKTIHVEGKGVDKRGGNRSKMVMDCHLTGDGASTRVCVDADITLSGAIAQFGRTGILTEIANVLVADFVRNAEAELTTPPSSADAVGDRSNGPVADRGRPAPAPTAAPISGSSLLLAALKSWFRSLFTRRAL